MNDYRIRHAAITTATSREQTTDFLNVDFQPKREGTLIRVTISLLGAVPVRIQPNTGADIKLQAAALDAEVMHVFEFALDPGRTWNFYTPDAAGATINLLLVDEVNA